MKPQRIQRRRVKGWRMPPNTVSVTRPGKWGNPYTVVAAGERYAVLNECAIITDGAALTRAGAICRAVAMFDRALRMGLLDVTVADVRRELRGKNLACYCPPGSPCHADVLLEVAAGGA